MADINMFQGGSTPLASISGDCGCGQFPSTYPSPERVASHYKAQTFTLADALDPAYNTNRQCLLCKLAPTVGEQTANVLDKKIGLLRVPARHLLTHLRVLLDPGNGAGAAFGVYIDLVNPTTGAIVGSGPTIPSMTGLALAGPLDVFAAIEPATAGLWTGADVAEIGVIFTAGPTTGTLCSWTGNIQFVSKVHGFDYGRD